MLPLSLLSAAENKPMLVELKNGETLNGHLMKYDSFMNLTMREVYKTSADPEHPRFHKLPACYVRGSTIKYIRVPEGLLDVVKEEQSRARESNRGARGGSNANRGGRGGPQRGARGGNRGAPARGGARGRGRGA